MARRDFIKLVLSSVAVGLFSRLPAGRAFAETGISEKPELPDLVGVREGSPAQMFEVGIKALGGMKRFVKRGQSVLVKPNIGWNKTPNEGATTNPELVGRIIKEAYKAGAKTVYVFDHTVNLEKKCYRRSGIEKAVKNNDGKMRSGEKERLYRKVTLDRAKVLNEVLVHKLYLDCDVVINVPILKDHGGGRMTAALKNLMGVVWDRQYWHKTDLQQAIGEFPLARKPELNVIDAYIVMTDNGPRGISTEDLSLEKMQILSTDGVLADTAAARILDLTLEEVPYLNIAAKLKLGTTDLKNSRIKRISLGRLTK